MHSFVFSTEPKYVRSTNAVSKWWNGNMEVPSELMQPRFLQQTFSEMMLKEMGKWKTLRFLCFSLHPCKKYGEIWAIPHVLNLFTGVSSPEDLRRSKKRGCFYYYRTRMEKWHYLCKNLTQFWKKWRQTNVYCIQYTIEVEDWPWKWPCSVRWKTK